MQIVLFSGNNPKVKPSLYRPSLYYREGRKKEGRERGRQDRQTGKRRRRKVKPYFFEVYAIYPQ